MYIYIYICIERDIDIDIYIIYIYICYFICSRAGSPLLQELPEIISRSRSSFLGINRTQGAEFRGFDPRQTVICYHLDETASARARAQCTCA